MRKSYFVVVILLVAAAVVTAGCRPEISIDRDTIYQVSPFCALMKGIYDGDTRVGQLKNYGNTGLGTVQALDGEMVMLDGRVYKAKLDGTIVEVPDDTLTPWAFVTFLDNDLVISLDQPMDMTQLQKYIDSRIRSENLFYAIRVDGKFSYMKTRSVTAQVKPYPRLVEAVKGQQVSEFHDIEGTVIGFRCPPYVDGVNVPGYHCHFIDKERTMGGHVLDMLTADVNITIDSTANFVMILPDTSGFYDVNLEAGEPEGLKQVEQGRE